MKRKQPTIAIGTLRVHTRGFGFLIPDDKSTFPADVFVPKRFTDGAVDGDRVEVKIHQDKTSEKGPEGSVIKILHRGRSHVAGTIISVTKKKLFAYVPILGEEKEVLLLPNKQLPLKQGDRVIIHIINWGSNKSKILGEVSSYIGNIEDPSCDIKAAIEEYDIDEEFSELAIEEAKSYGDSVKRSSLKNREDLTKLNCFTIDPETAKDFDDALSIEEKQNGETILGVHIADVSYYVKPGSELDKEAMQRCNSVYFPGFVVPMLPHELSSHLCSLKPSVNRLTISVFMLFDKDGELKEYEIKRSVIKSHQRFSYQTAKQILDNKLPSPFSKDLKIMEQLCYKLKKQRAKRGSIEFALPDTNIVLDSSGMPIKVDLVEYDISHQLVEEFMLKANEVVATHLGQQGKPLTYRIHDEPSPENIGEFVRLATSLGFKIPEEPTSEELQNLFDQARDSPFGQFLAVQFIRTMKLATYSTQNIGHYGLCLDHYTHFTSPIRRYIDLIVHRLLFDDSEPDKDLEKIASFCSEKERISAKAENSVVMLKKLRLLELLQKNNHNHKYEAVVTSVKPFGFTFELSELLIEGFLPHPYNHTPSPGDQIIVKPLNINKITQQVIWKLERI